MYLLHNAALVSEQAFPETTGAEGQLDALDALLDVAQTDRLVLVRIEQAVLEIGGAFVLVLIKDRIFRTVFLTVRKIRLPQIALGIRYQRIQVARGRVSAHGSCPAPAEGQHEQHEQQFPDHFVCPLGNAC